MEFKNEVTQIVLMIFFGIILNYSFYKISIHNPKHLNIYSFLTEIYIPVLLILVPFLVISRVVVNKKVKVEEAEEEKEIVDEKIIIKGENQNDFFELEFQKLIYIQSSNVYIDIVYIENKGIKKITVRSKISNVEKKNPQLIKTHRSYLINPNHYKFFKNEGNNLFVYLLNDIKIPISRNRRKDIKEQILSLQ